MGSVAILEEIYRPMIHRDPKDAIGALQAHIEVIYSTYGGERWISKESKGEVSYCYRMIEEARARSAKLMREEQTTLLLARNDSPGTSRRV